jgi:hypothetical protein
VLVQYGKLACASFPPQWNDVRDAFVFVQEGKLAHVSFPPQCNDVVRDAVVLMQEGNH